MTRRLVGWRVRWEHRVRGVWTECVTSLQTLPDARELARFSPNPNVRAVRIVRVYRRSKR